MIDGVLCCGVCVGLDWAWVGVWAWVGEGSGEAGWVNGCCGGAAGGRSDHNRLVGIDRSTHTCEGWAVLACAAAGSIQASHDIGWWVRSRNKRRQPPLPTRSLIGWQEGHPSKTWGWLLRSIRSNRTHANNQPIHPIHPITPIGVAFALCWLPRPSSSFAQCGRWGVGGGMQASIIASSPRHTPLPARPRAATHPPSSSNSTMGSQSSVLLPAGVRDIIIDRSDGAFILLARGRLGDR